MSVFVCVCANGTEGKTEKTRGRERQVPFHQPPWSRKRGTSFHENRSQINGKRIKNSPLRLSVYIISRGEERWR